MPDDTVAIHPTALNVKRSITVDVPQERAFEVFTAGIDSWWPRSHHIGSSPMTEIFLEPRAGGRAYTMQEDGTECDWGSVIAWEPPSRVVLGWSITAEWTFDPDFITEVDVRFIPEGPERTLVELEHRNLERYGAAADQMIEAVGGDGGWTGLLTLFAEATTR